MVKTEHKQQLLVAVDHKNYKEGKEGCTGFFAWSTRLEKGGNDNGKECRFEVLR